nr:PREDICTED: grainyhead-like protein 1 homolog [Latimeria chalumnae]|eukprot:XP_005998742.1 PREDICTED: grainyhead-like protein 1 homolog [Latimeria chalumnae]
MTQEHDNKRPVLVLQNEALYPQRRSYTSEDEAWKSFLENPLTAATKAMMSINGDEDSAAALGLLYDYYKVPRDKRTILPAKADVAGAEPDPNKRNCIPSVTEPPTIPSADNRVQVLKGVPLNIVLPSNQLGHDKRGQFAAPDTTVTVSIAAVPTQSIKTETHPHGFTLGIPSSVYCSESAERIVVFDQNLNNDQFSSNPLQSSSQRRTPDSTFSETFKDGEQEVFFPHDLQLRMPSIGPEDYSFDNVTRNNFEYTLEASKSLRQKPGDGTMTYLNKGQFYPVMLRELSNNKGIHNPITKVRVFISVNCLSTDFSSQKGVKGLPLNIQIDTYSYNNRSNKPVHRTYCQIKVFCDKGAERKIRDEERKQSKRKVDVKLPMLQPHKRTDLTVFKRLNDFDTQPVLFIPDIHFSSMQRGVHVFPISSEELEVEGSVMKRGPFVSEEDFGSPPSKLTKLDEPKRVLLYVRKESEEVFDALMLKTPSLKGLIEAISEKYEVPLDKIGKVYKQCKKGILVNMDDNIIKHYSNEDTFQLQIEEAGGSFKLTLSEI